MAKKINHRRTVSSLLYRIAGIRRVKTPTLLQMEALECGAAALGIVLAFYKKYVPLEKLRVDCGVSRNGSKAGNLAKAARNYGMEAKAYRKEPEQLGELPLPVIVFWNFNHFVVVEGFGRNKVYLNDPATGPRTVDDRTFDGSYTGIVLTFKPGSGFEQGGEKSKFLPFLSKWLKNYRKSLIFLFLVGFAMVLPGLAVPAFSRIFVDQVLIRHAGSWIFPMLAGLTLTALLRTLLSWIQQHSLIRFEMSLSLGNSSKFMWYVLNLPMSFHVQRTAGDIATRVNANDQIAALLSGQLGNTLLNLVMIVFYAAMMFYYSADLAAIVIAVSLLNLVALKWISRKRIDSNRKFQQDNGRLYGLSTSGLQAIETMKASASESDFFTRWSGHQARLLSVQQKLGTLTQSLQGIPILLTSVSTVIILLAGSEHIISGAMTVGTFVAFQSLMASFSQPIVSLVNLGSMLQDVQGGMARIEDIYNYPAATALGTPAEMPAPGKEVKLQGAVTLKNVVFGYGRFDPPEVKDVSLTLRPGSRTAIVGRTGCGKSTIANLVGGLYEPWDGEILFDGRPRNTLPQDTLHNSIAFVDQNLFLFEGTVRENIAFWDDTVTDKEIIQAARDACIHEDIAARPGAYDSQVSENGRNFSGGQRQRIEIARALASKPALLILDEATSALDARTEYLIDMNIRKTGCTCLIIAHRLSTIRDCDEIIVLEHGRIVQRGTHDELICQEGLYRQLILE